MDNIPEKIDDFSSSSVSDDDMPSTFFCTKKSLLGRTDSVHVILGGGKAADIVIVLWRNKLVSGTIFACVTMIWLLSCFFWPSFLSGVMQLRSPTEVTLSDDILLQDALYVSHEINEAFITFCYIGSGKDISVFVKVIAGLWLLSVVGSWFSLLTFSYIVFVLAFAVPVIYETHEDSTDRNWDKSIHESENNWNKISIAIKEALKKIPRRLKYE